MNLDERLPRASASTRRLNPGLFAAVLPGHQDDPGEVKPRLRQNRGPKLNKTEEAFLAYLRAAYPGAEVRAQELTLLLANGCRYTPDFTVVEDAANGHDVSLWRAFETKGPYARDDSLVKLKVAAARWPKIQFFLASRGRPTGWRIERVFP